MLINGASFPHKAQRPTVGREIMYAEFTGAVGCCCRAGGRTSLEQNDSCIEMRRPRPSCAHWKWGEWTPVICGAMTAHLLYSDERRSDGPGVVRENRTFLIKNPKRHIGC